MLTLDQGEKSASLPLYINSEVSYDFDDADLLNYCTLRMAGDDYARISGLSLIHILYGSLVNVQDLNRTEGLLLT